MKRVILTLVFAAAAMGVAAQNGIAIVESGSVALYPDDSGESFSVNVAGLNIGFKRAENPHPFERQGPVYASPNVSLSGKETSITVSPQLEFGFNYLLTPDYSLYPASAGEFLDLHTGKSIHFAWNPVVVKGSFDRRNIFGITSGLSLVWRDYAFSDRNMTVARVDGMLAPVRIDGNFKKTKLTVFALRVPLLLTITEPKSKIGVGFGGYVDFVTGSHTKYKSPKNKERGDFYVEPVQLGLQARVRYKGMGMFANYGLNNMFQNNRAPATTPLTIGFGFGF